MRPHLIVRLRPGEADRDLPHWSAILEDKRRAPERMHPDVDRLLDRYRVPVWATHEYAPADATWSPAERESGMNRVYRLILQQTGRVPPGLIEDIRLVPAVEDARPGRVADVPLPKPVSTALAAVTGQASRDAIGLEEAQRYSRGDREVVVAVLDTGVALDHPELREALLPGHDFVDIIDGAAEFIGDVLDADEEPSDDVGHGTHVSGIVAGAGRRMPVGVAPRCRILPVRVLAAFKQGERQVGAGLVDNINTGVKWAVDQGADVINMSLGVRHAAGGLPHQEVVEYARRKDVTIVAASGNDGREQLYYPGALPGVIAVGAADENGEVAGFSTWGRQVSFLAPGENIYSSYLNDGYAASSGTSHASPFVAGGVALLKSYARERGRRLTDKQAKHVLKHTADKVDREFKHPKAGFGRLNLGDALRLLEAKLN